MTQEIVTEMNEHFSEELVAFTISKLADGFVNRKNLNSITNSMRQALTDREKGSWMCLFLPDDIKYACSIAKYRYLRLSFMRKDQKYGFILA